MPGEGPRLLNGEQGSTLLWRGILFYPLSDPVNSARRKARGLPLAPRTLVFVPSVGLGYGLAELLERLPEHCGVLCVEAFPEVMSLAMAQGLPHDPRMSIVRTGDPAAAAAAVRALGTSRFRRVVEVALCGGYRLARDGYAGIRQAVEQELVGYWRNRLTLTALGSRMVSNLMDNLLVLPGARDVSDLSTELPVVVAGAGPSLDATIEALAGQRDGFALVAVDTAVPALASHSVIPDLIVALEAQVSNLQDFIPARDPAPLLACELTSHPSVTRLYEGRLCFFSSEFAPIALLERLESERLLPTVTPALGSVGVCAAWLSLRLTRRDVYLTGLDFSFPEGRTHARGTPYHLAMLHRCDRVQPVGQLAFQALASRDRIRLPDKSGSPVQTDGVLRSYRDTLKRETAGDQVRLADLGATGLDLGVRTLTAAEALARLRQGPRSSPRLAVAPIHRFPRDRLEAFLRSERELLLRASAAAREAAAAGAMAAECLPLLRAVRHAWVHFPDEPDLEAAGPSFLARASVAAEYYARRLDRVASLLGSLENRQEG